MKCPRCNGFLASERHFFGLREFDGFRCLLCGSYIDPVSLVNKAASLPLEQTEEVYEID